MEHVKFDSSGTTKAGGMLVCCLLALGALLSACSHSKEYDRMEASITGAYAAQPPAFLNGPMSALLTNANGFTAHVTAQGDTLATTDGLSSGQLLCRGSKLLFAPALNVSKKKTARAGGFAFIWDVASASGYVLSGALQGYAPVSSGSRATNVVYGAKAPPDKSQTGAPGAEIDVVNLNDGTSATFNVWRAPNGIPTRISVAGSGIPLTLMLSDVQPSPPAGDVFTPPEEFTKYTSPESLADEVVARQHNLHRKAPIPLDTAEPIKRPGY